MLARLGTCLLALTLAFCTLSCQKMPEWAVGGGGAIAAEDLLQPDSIPIKWGELVSVTTTPRVDYRSQLWFKDGEGTVRMVVYDLRANELLPKARVFTRK